MRLADKIFLYILINNYIAIKKVKFQNKYYIPKTLYPKPMDPLLNNPSHILFQILSS